MPKRPPNLLFVFSDQQSYDMLGCYGNEQIITPHIDALAADGIRFTYCISSDPVCTPARAMLLSGQHPLKCGAFTNDVQMLPGCGTTFAEALAEAGYATGYVGKWHLLGGDRNRPVPEGPLRYGFRETFLTNNCMLNYDANAAFYFDQETGEKTLFGKWEAEGQTDQALAFLDRYSADSARPFALFVSYHAPHDHGGVADSDKTFPYPLGYMAPKRLMDLYDRDEIRLRPNASATEDSGITPTRSMDRVREDYHGHYALCAGIDEQVGRLVAKLKELGQYDDTVIVYTSDHGDLLGSHGRPWAKSFPEDESARVPLVVRWPAAARRGVSDLLVGTLDIMPTVLGMLGLDAPVTCDGQDLSAAVRNAHDDAVESVPLFYFGPDWRGVFTRRYTYAFARPGSTPELCWDVLYDREQDPHQQKNLFDDREYANVKADLHHLACGWLERFDDDIIDCETLMTEICGLPEGNQCRPGMTGELPGRPIDVIQAWKVAANST